MRYELRDCRTGRVEEDRRTTVRITLENDIATFKFDCKNSLYYCPHSEYNAMHCEGDVCEVFIGTDPSCRQYYEIEISPQNCLFLAKITYKGEKFFWRKIVLETEYVEKSFVKSNVIKNEDGYVATLQIPLTQINTGDGEVFFNAFRIETNGGKCIKSKQLLYALNPTMRPKFHVPSKFITLDKYITK